MAAVVNKDTCVGCEACVASCPVEAIAMVDGKAEVNDACVDCGACVSTCPVEAISL
jgi:ferredoxin